MFPQPVGPPAPLSVFKKKWILAKFRNENVNFMAKINGPQNFT